ncbi:MAG: DnaJ domain-containing protein [Silicimonas sp.]|nr:DnaJ domain-containing protein [Silicimonas sp.]
MTPIERISARSKALSTLGMAGNPTKSELRKAFRKLAFERHPDHGKGTPEEFAKISDAYTLLVDTAEDDTACAARPATRVSRPAVPATETEFDEDTLTTCESLFDGLDATCARHLATRLYRKGRMLTYLVPSAPADGLNKVALPTGDLVDTRRIEPKLLDIWSGDIAAGVYDMPAQLSARHFPGARSVQIRFGRITRH